MHGSLLGKLAIGDSRTLPLRKRSCNRSICTLERFERLQVKIAVSVVIIYAAPVIALLKTSYPVHGVAIVISEYYACTMYIIIYYAP